MHVWSIFCRATTFKFNSSGSFDVISFIWKDTWINQTTITYLRKIEMTHSGCNSQMKILIRVQCIDWFELIWNHKVDLNELKFIQTHWKMIHTNTGIHPLRVQWLKFSQNDLQSKLINGCTGFLCFSDCESWWDLPKRSWDSEIANQGAPITPCLSVFSRPLSISRTSYLRFLHRYRPAYLTTPSIPLRWHSFLTCASYDLHLTDFTLCQIGMIDSNWST